MKMHAVFFVLTMAGWPPADRPHAWPKIHNPRVSLGDDGTLSVDGTRERTQTHLLTIDDPQVPSHQYRLVGRIKYDHVAGDGYVELLNRFPGRGEFFSRTLAEGGAFGKLTGSSDWRDLELPFLSEPGLLPDRLTVNLVLPGQGKVWITPLRLEALSVPGAAEPGGFDLLSLLPALLLGAVAILTALLGAFLTTRRLALWLCRIFAMASLLSLVGSGQGMGSEASPGPA